MGPRGGGIRMPSHRCL
ncbi:rCG37241 [Rattus norvegicus]|uniref:RCG37241 n=1 Tax=Rattus norvegicus TaxID=10116 RepID=A6KHS3_RAT|nr:rCG37241 [Rattus norvegicus]